jgi:hypothetical protein
MRFVSLAVAVLAALGLASGSASACDSNGCYQMTRGDAAVGKGKLRVDLSFRATDQSDRLNGTSATDSVRRPKVWLEGGYMWPGFHEELDGRERFLQLDVSYGLGARTSVFATAPLRASRAYTLGHGNVTQPYRPYGYGDTLVGVRRSFASRFTATVGVKVPTGTNDLIDAYDGTILDPMLQPGTGSWDALASVAMTFRALEPGLRWTAALSRQQGATNEYDYRFGAETIATLGVRRAVYGPLDLAVQAKLFDKGRSTFIGEPVGSTGARYLYVTPAAHLRLPQAMTAYVLAPVPMYRNVNESQLAPRFGIIAGVSRTF